MTCRYLTCSAFKTDEQTGVYSVTSKLRNRSKN